MGPIESIASNETLLDDLICAGRYRIGETISEGTTGHLFRARRLSDHREVVLKCGSSASEMARTSLRAEASALASLDHPNIVRFIEHREGSDVCFLAMEALDGIDLAERLRRGPISRAQSLAFLAELSSALDHVHARGLIHRDIKPANVMVVRASDGVEHAVLVDFGLASPRLSRDRKRTRFLCGTPAYMAPEQALGLDAEVSSATDRYALAAVALELLTGQRPYPNASIPELIAMVIERSPRKPSELGDFDARLDAVFAKGLARDSDRRFSSCAALVLAIEAALSHPSVRPRARPGRARAERSTQRPPMRAKAA